MYKTVHRCHLTHTLNLESVERGATILYATHIFDGLNAFPTHVAHMRHGEFVTDPTPWPLSQETIDAPNSVFTAGSSLHTLALHWLRLDRQVRKDAEASGKLAKTRGSRHDVRF